MDAISAVLKYLSDQNRPYSLNDIFSNMHKEHGKTAIQKSLDVLVQDGRVIEKTYGKQKVYGFNQRNGCANSSNADIVDIEGETHKITDELSKIENLFRRAESTLNEYNLSLTTEDAEKELTRISKEIEEMTEDINVLKCGKEVIPASVCESIFASHKIMLAEWRKRKHQCMQMVAVVTESMPQNKADFMSELGMETDEDLNVSLTTFESLHN